MRVTLALMTFNQAPYLAEAIDSALAQDYRPLRILISDNGSSDNTQEIVQSALKNYGGPHDVQTTRIPENTGSPSSHLNALVPHLEDEIIVLQAGDDRSHPGRVSAIVKAFAANPQARMVFHAWDVIDAQGRNKERGGQRLPGGGDHLTWFASVSRYALGATLAIRRALLLEWPALPSDIFEDNVLPFRAALHAPIVYQEQSLLDYRWHSGNTLGAEHKMQSLYVVRENVQRGLARQRQIAQVRAADLARALDKGLIDLPRSQRILRVIEESLQDAELNAQLFDRHRGTRIKALRQLWGRSPSAKAQLDLLAKVLWPQAWIAYRQWRQKR